MLFLNLPLVSDLNFINNVNGKFSPIAYGSSRVYFSINGIKHQKNLVTAGQTPIFFLSKFEGYQYLFSEFKDLNTKDNI